MTIRAQEPIANHLTVGCEIHVLVGMGHLKLYRLIIAALMGILVILLVKTCGMDAKPLDFSEADASSDEQSSSLVEERIDIYR